ncbi:MAG TPA: 3' terminal RNA ribose 2'-O-methyltransferase Hen1 [Streptosporangiaceae bacterium]|nr:3' terminal RNA ribose 2'-O-methyltransferase Hen1 [Streptosporangiaceae bacterium]
MLLTITTEPAATGGGPPVATGGGRPAATGAGWPATDLGFLLHKNPGRVQSFPVSVGDAHVFYPEASASRCTAALLLEVDPVGLVRGRHGAKADGFSLAQYVNDRPYAASSMLAVALARVFKTAMAGRCDARPELAASAIPLTIGVPVLPCRGGCELAARLFEPLGWTARAVPIALDETIPSWGDSRYLELRLDGVLRLADALNHLYVMLPVLDDAKHYWVSPEEVDKLIRAGGGWLAGHPHKTLITRRYLAHRTGLYRSALARLAEVDDTAPESFDNAIAMPGQPDAQAAAVPRFSLGEQRRAAVLATLREAGARRVADLGCGEGALTGALLADPAFTEVIAADVSSRALDVAGRRLRVDRMPAHQRGRLKLIQSSLTYTDARLAGLDAVALIEVIEHIDEPRLGALERCVFTDSAPATVVVTTPNAEYNVRYACTAHDGDRGGHHEGHHSGHHDGDHGAGQAGFRHRDHRFEWTREQFEAWARRVSAERGYEVRFEPIGPGDPQVGSPTQMAVFTRAAGVSESAARGSAGHDASLDYVRAVT